MKIIAAGLMFVVISCVGNCDSILERLEKQLEIEMRYNAALREYNEGGDYGWVKGELEKLLKEKQFDHPVAYYILGAIYKSGDLRDDKKAISYFREFIKRSSNETRKEIARAQIAHIIQRGVK